jgi:hypothetical protein
MKKSFAVFLAACFLAAGTQVFGQQSNQLQQGPQSKTKKEVVVKDNKNKGMGSRDTISSKQDNQNKSTTVKKKTEKKSGDKKQVKKTTKENR